jgi:RimJ/RimL family protein N-acetyltransferase
MAPIFSPVTAEQKDVLLTWAESRLRLVPASFDRETSYPLCVGSMFRPQAVVVYSQWRGSDIEVTIVADTPRWARRSVIAELLAWPFERVGVQRITARIADRNTRSRRLASRLGFVCEGCQRAWFDDDDAILYGMTRHDWARSRYRRVTMERAA